MPTPMPKLQLASLFTDHAVLQRRQKIPVWGWSAPGARLTLVLGNENRTTEANQAGAFRVDFNPREAGGTLTLTVTCSVNGTLTVSDLLVGEVWLCSGQSNMDWPCSVSGFGLTELAGGLDQVRLFRVPPVTAGEPQTVVTGSWTAADETHLANFTGVGVAFGRELRTHLDCPIGLIHSAWGGTPAEAWTSLPALAASAPCMPIIDRWRVQALSDITPDSPRGKELMLAWERDTFYQDPGISAAASKWMDPALNEGDWLSMDLPQTLGNAGVDINGAVWFRRSFDLPATLTGRDVVLRLGVIDDFDTTWINGEHVGGIGKENPNAFATARTYQVSARFLRPGRNVIAVRVFDHFGPGGVYQGPLRVSTADGALNLDLEGPWKYRVELALPPRRTMTPLPFSQPANYPAYLFNAMIAPLVPYAMQGAIWYQGESNAGRAEQYRTLLTAMINDWRAHWGREFPFGIVQLNAWQPRLKEPGESSWAELREAQSRVATDLKQVWRAVGIDTGEADDIHPKNKPLIGYRLALLARRHVYGDTKLIADSPSYAGMSIEGAAIRVRLADARGLTALGGNPVPGFTIAGADRKWHHAVATLEGDSVVVHSLEVIAPVAVRYAWADCPTVSLVNAAGLPVDAFRTDDWPMITAGVR